MTKLASRGAPNADDKALLELAAQGARIDVDWSGGSGFTLRGCTQTWNPLADDGDALRLAMKLLLTVSFGVGSVCVSFPGYSIVDDTSKGEAAARRAIVCAAAEIGKQRS